MHVLFVSLVKLGAAENWPERWAEQGALSVLRKVGAGLYFWLARLVLNLKQNRYR